ncbi:periplasmic heavy metal sensor [Caulobacter sp. 17J65-9]|uniref:periplasmic heavy metal sensor n=1 Tax=Caulobacter sp. 17J65-9 TaxID=2709382 RepID=UPI0013CA026E|nr:periplasmic heavy metal sensor [Caulobacter sp. 17J65-9]NEX91246.1 periplasmic heavy metal sensor [Caulobacter sp. 17J65-9]
MTIAWRSLALTAVLAALAGGAGAWIGGHYFVRMNMAPPSLHGMAHEELNLTAEQDRRLDAEEARFAERRRVLEAEVRKANAELAAAIKGSAGYGPSVQTAVERSHAAMGELEKETIVHVFAMRSILTPEQAKAFDTRVAEALTEEHQ